MAEFPFAESKNAAEISCHVKSTIPTFKNIDAPIVDTQKTVPINCYTKYGFFFIWGSKLGTTCTTVLYSTSTFGWRDFWSFKMETRHFVPIPNSRFLLLRFSRGSRPLNLHPLWRQSSPFYLVSRVHCSNFFRMTRHIIKQCTVQRVWTASSYLLLHWKSNFFGRKNKIFFNLNFFLMPYSLTWA